MGSWYDYLKKLKKPNHIRIEPVIMDGSPELRVILQYLKPRLHSVTITVGEVGINLKQLSVDVKKGEKWGDWGGAIKVCDVVYITKKEKVPITPEKVKFT